MVLKAAVQALKKADVLKAQAAQANAALQNDKGNCVNILLNDSATWSARQQLTNALHQVLVLDLDYALDQKVEQELWTHGFKNYIATLQSLSRDKKNPKRSELQALLAWCLESATGFYLTLFQELCEAFQLDLPFRRRGIAYGSIVGRSVEQPVVTPQRSSCLYICQYCLVHLGDIARYRNQRKQAESFYKQAILLSPSSGQPYNQLALLQASRGDRLSTVFYYVRSVTLTYPFPPASTNLSKTLEMATNDVSHSESRTKMSVSEYISVFLKLHGLLQIGCDLNKTEIMVKNLTSALTALAATESFSSHRLIQMLAINLYALRETIENFTEDQLTKDETRIKNFVLDLMAGFLNAFLLPVYTLQSSNLLEYHSLPAIKLILEWIKLEPKYLENVVFTSRLQIWPSLCLLLNSVQKFIKDFEEKKYTMIPLPEDRDLQAFLPLDKAFQKLDFNTEDYKQDINFLNKLRAARLLQLGHWLTTCQVNGNYLITAKISEDKSEYIFEPVSKQESNVSDLLKELEQMKIDSENTDVSSGSKENSQDDDIPTISQITVVDQPVKVHQRLRTGILKPQGSLERAREEREQALLLNAGSSENSLFSNSSNSDTSNTISATNIQNRVIDVPVNNSGAVKSGKKTRQNVAMQAILKKVEENSKQVKFQTDDDSETAEKMLKETSENTTKEEGNSKKGILSLKNQSGYPHLSENNDVPVTDNYSPSGINQRKLLNNDPKISTMHLNSETNIQSLGFPSVLYDPQFASTNNPNSNHNFSTASFISPNLSSNNPYRNMPEFISQSSSNIVKNNDLSPLQHYYMKTQNLQSQKFPVSNAGQGFDYCPPQNQMSNFPPHPQLNNLSFETTNPTFNNPNAMYPPSSNNNPSSSFQQFNNKFPTPLTSNPPNPYNNKLVLGPDFNLDNDNIRNSDNKIQQMPYNSAQNNYVMKNNNLWGTNQIDNKLPMPPNGWWPNSANNHDTNQFVTNTYEHYRDLNISTQQSSFLGDNYGTKSDINLSKTNDAISRQNMSWNNTLPPAPNINLPPPYHQIMLPNQNKTQPLNNNDQGLTMRQKILKENRKLYSRKVMDSVNEPFEPTSNPNQSVSPPGYSLFNSNWAPNFSSGSSINASPTINQQNDQNGPLLGQQSLFSGPGPSPLERLLEQQKQLRGVPPK